LLLDNNTWERVAEIVGESDFYRHEHRVIFNAITALATSNTPFDLVILADTLTRKGRLDAVGGKTYLITLIRDTPSTANIQVYAGIVRKYSMLRQMITTGAALIDNAYCPKGRDVSELIDDAERNIFAIAEREARVRGGFQPISLVLKDAIARIDALSQAESRITGLPTGFTKLDALTSGLQPADLIIIAGRPSMGKTALAMNIAEYVVMTAKRSVAIFSMEMPSQSLGMRMLSSLGRIDQQKVRTGQLDNTEWACVTTAMAKLSTAELFIDDTPALSPLELRTRARRLKREWNDLGLIVIDYLQLMQASNHENRNNEVAEISRALKALAKELNIPIIAISQLNRSLEQRQNKRPVMSDLRESGALEQDADLILFVYRDEVYNPESKDAGTAEIIIAKQRNGPIGTVRLTFLGKFTKFENFIGDDSPQDVVPPQPD